MLEQGYWFIPNVVLFNNELSDKQKLLYCLVSSLCAEKGYCWATNEYLGKKLWVTLTTISRNIATLIEKWFIVMDLKNWNERILTLDENDKGGWQKCQGTLDENDKAYIYKNNISEYNNTKENKEKFERFWKEYPHARKGKKKESEQYFLKQDANEVLRQVAILKWKIKAWLQDGQYIPACERRIRDFTPISEDVIKQDLVKICKRHLNADGDIKQRASELKETFWEEQIKQIVKAIQQKDSPKNLFINKTN